METKKIGVISRYLVKEHKDISSEITRLLNMNDRDDQLSQLFKEQKLIKKMHQVLREYHLLMKYKN